MNTRHGNRQKHESANPLQRYLISRFHAQAVRLIRESGARSILEVGCGEGYVLKALVDAGIDAQLYGVDLSPSAISDARRRLPEHVRLEIRDARDLAELGQRFDMVMMLEVLEHITDPAQMFPVLETLTTRYLLLSVPWEPFFRGLNLARGKNVRQWGNDPEHINHWGRGAFRTFVNQRFDVARTPLVFPWTMVLAELRAGG